MTGRIVGNLAREGSAIRESLVGNAVGVHSPSLTISIIRDAIIGRSTGSLSKYMSVTREVVDGQRVGLDLQPVFINVVREMLVRSTSYKFGMTTRETLGSQPGAPLRVAAKNGTFRMMAGQHRATALPSTVHSMQIVPSLFQVAAAWRSRLKPISVETNRTLRQVAALKRAALPVAEVLSMETTGSFSQIVAMSRIIAHVPVSGVFTRTERMMAAQRRVTAAPAGARSAISAGTVIAIAAVHRSLEPPPTRYDYAISNIQVVAQHRAPADVIGAESVGALSSVAAQARAVTAPAGVVSPIYVSGHVQVVANYRKTYAPSSHMDTATLASIAALLRTPIIGYGGEQATTVTQIVAQHRDAAAQLSVTRVSTAHMVAAQQRDAAWAVSTSTASTARQIVAIERIPGPLPPTPMYATGYVQIVAQLVAPAMAQGSADVGAIQVLYALGRDTVPPGSVFPPGTGHNAGTLRAVVAQQRTVQTPGQISGQSRFVRHLVSEVAMGDSFPSSSLATSDALASNVLGIAAVGDVFGDKDVPQSDAAAGNVVEVVAMSDVFGDKDAVISDAVVTSLAARPVVGDSYPDPNVPVSDAQAWLVAAQIALGDAQFPPKDQARSDLSASLVGTLCALGDVFPDLTLPASSATTQIIVQFAILGDDTLARLPLRTNRRRPIISVSIS